MAKSDLPPMVPGGQWINVNNGIHYIVDPDHIKRLLSEGGQIVSDPRVVEKDIERFEKEEQAQVVAPKDADEDSEPTHPLRAPRRRGTQD